MVIKSKKGQTWSFDLIVAVVLFVIVIALFYTFLSGDNSKTDKVTMMESSVQTISSKLNCDLSSDESICIIKKGHLKNDSLNSFSSKDYEDLKVSLGIKGDFCIYLIDKDGYYVPMGDKIGVGSGDLLLVNQSGITLYCGDDYNIN